MNYLIPVANQGLNLVRQPQIQKTAKNCQFLACLPETLA